MPGKVTAAHAKIEQDCKQCHDRANRERQAQLCSTCHKDCRRRRARPHGLARPHTERRPDPVQRLPHRAPGRDGDIVHLSPLALNHTATDFPLEGRHASVPCSSCHASGKRYREAPRQCAACHRDDDAHLRSSRPRLREVHAPAAGATRASITMPPDTTSGAVTPAFACASCHAGNRYDGRRPVACPVTRPTMRIRGPGS
jgi:ubiquitin